VGTTKDHSAAATLPVVAGKAGVLPALWQRFRR
jgi:hypothetical protein